MKMRNAIVCAAAVIALSIICLGQSPLPDYLRVGYSAWLSEMEQDLVAECVEWLREEGVSVDLEMSGEYFPETVTSRGYDLFFALSSQLYSYEDFESAGYNPILTLTTGEIDELRPVFVVNEGHCDVDSLDDLRDPGYTVGGPFAASDEAIAALAASGVSVTDVHIQYLDEETTVLMLLNGDLDVGVFSDIGISTFFERDLKQYLGLKAIGYGLAFPLNSVLLAGPTLDDELRETLQTQLIAHSFDHLEICGFGWADEDACVMRQAVSRHSADWWNGYPAQELLDLLVLDADYDNDGVADVFDVCPQSAEVAEEDNTLRYLGRDGCPCLLESDGQGQILHLLVPANMTVEEELALLAQVARQYGYLDLGHYLDASLAASHEGRGSDLLQTLDMALQLPPIAREVLALPAAAQTGAQDQSREQQEDTENKDILSWINDRTASILKTAQCYIGNWDQAKDALASTKYAMTKLSGRVGTKLVTWSAVARSGLGKFPRALKALKGFGKALGVINSIAWIYENNTKYQEAWYEAMHIFQTQRGEGSYTSFQVILHERLTAKYGTSNYVSKAVYDLLPHKLVETVGKFIWDCLSYLADGIEGGPYSTGPALTTTPEEIKLLENAYESQERLGAPQHITIRHVPYGKIIKFRQNADYDSAGDWEINTSLGMNVKIQK